MQLNLYIPRDRENVVTALDEAARRLGRQKNEIVLDALETYLTAGRPRVGTFRLGPVTAGTARGDLYLEEWDREPIAVFSAPETSAARRKRAR